jgi:hypothetical protein
VEERRGKEREKISVAVTADIYVGCEGSTMSSVCELGDLTDWSVLHCVPFFLVFLNQDYYMVLLLK